MTSYTWNAADYDRNANAQRTWAIELLDGLKLQPHEDVLDMGCGDGKITAEIAARVPSGSATGVDLSGGMIAHASQAYRTSQPNLRFAQADARALPFSNGFDAVFSNAALHWIVDHRAALAGISRSLRPGGRCLMQMGGRGNAAGILRAVDPTICGETWGEYFRDFAFPYGFFGPDDYEAWMAEVGLKPVRLELIPKDMIHAGQAGLEGWIRTTWLPYTSRIPAARRDDFVREVAARYLEENPLDASGLSHVQMIRLEAEAVRSS